jgi:predicted dehydrogenase
MDKILNWGLLSTARINRALIPPINASGRSRLAAVASRSQATADAYAREWKIPRALGSYEALIDDPEIDVIYNPLPNSMHAEWSIRAMRAGKHVLCEKPLALTVDEVDAMAAASKSTGRIVAEAFMYRHQPQTLKVQELVNGGALGTLQTIKGCFTFTLDREGNFRFQREMGGGSIWDVGCYPISYARMLVGAEPLEVFGWQVTGPGGSDETFIGQLRFADGVHAQFDSGFRSPLRTSIEIIGSDGALNVPVPFKPGRAEKIYLTRGDITETIEIKEPDLYVGEVEDICDAILLARPPRVSLADSRGNVQTILALLESAESGSPVAL